MWRTKVPEEHSPWDRSINSDCFLGPSYHGCGSIRGNRKKFPERKEKKRKGGIFWLTITLSIGKNFRNLPQNILLVIPLFHNTSGGWKIRLCRFFIILNLQKRIHKDKRGVCYPFLYIPLSHMNHRHSFLILPLHPSFSQFQHFLLHVLDQHPV